MFSFFLFLSFFWNDQKELWCMNSHGIIEMCKLLFLLYVYVWSAKSFFSVKTLFLYLLSLFSNIKEGWKLKNTNSKLSTKRDFYTSLFCDCTQKSTYTYKWVKIKLNFTIGNTSEYQSISYFYMCGLNEWFWMDKFKLKR